MKKIKKISKAKILIALLVIAAVVFGIYNVLWFKHIAIMNEIVNSEGLQKIKNTPSEAPENFTTASGVEYVGYHYSRYSYEEYEGWIYHDFRDFDYNEVSQGKSSYHVALPPYLRFAGGIQVLNSNTVNETEEYKISLDISVKDRSYYISLSEGVRQGGHSVSYGIGSADIDKNGQVIEYWSPHPTEESMQETIAAFEKYNELIMEMMTTVNEMFGEILH